MVVVGRSVAGLRWQTKLVVQKVEKSSDSPDRTIQTVKSSCTLNLCINLAYLAFGLNVMSQVSGILLLAQCGRNLSESGLLN